MIYATDLEYVLQWSTLEHTRNVREDDVCSRPRWTTFEIVDQEGTNDGQGPDTEGDGSGSQVKQQSAKA